MVENGLQMHLRWYLQHAVEVMKSNLYQARRLQLSDKTWIGLNCHESLPVFVCSLHMWAVAAPNLIAIFSLSPHRN